MTLRLERIKNSDKRLRRDMSVHYSQPGGFVGRNLCYAVIYDNKYYGAIVAGSTPMHLLGRDIFCSIYGIQPTLNQIINNLFYHVEGPYPIRNFTIKVLQLYRTVSELDWFMRYGDRPLMHESLVELPRSGEIYKRDGWYNFGTTKGFTCKRIGGKGTDSYGGQRVWDRENLRPKLVFRKII